MSRIRTFGSVCSGIEAASFVLESLGVKGLWLSEIQDFASRFLSIRYPNTPNLGDMNDIPEMLKKKSIVSPDLLCGGTPCQAFSLAGWQNGLIDDRGQLTLKYIDILDCIDANRSETEGRAVFFWENVEGVLTDKTNAFGCFLAGLAGYDKPLVVPKWTSAGILHGRKRNVAWRVLDAKYFGLAQQRKRIYVLGGGKDFYPENILFEVGNNIADPYKINECADLALFRFDELETAVPTKLQKVQGRQKFEIFRTYTDCLYAAYGTKWNGNAAAYNGSLFVAQNGRLRRLTPIECERLMGFPDKYTEIPKCTLTNRFHAAGNSWAVNVVRWIMSRLVEDVSRESVLPSMPDLVLLKDFYPLENGLYLNATNYPYDFRIVNFIDFVDECPDERLYISPAGCSGILRRKRERNVGMNKRLEEILLQNCGQ